MCGRVTQFSRWAEIVRNLGAPSVDAAPRFNISPGTPLLSVRREQGVLRTEALPWGFVPAWAPADDDTSRRTLCLVTVAPNREAGDVHSRMPVCLFAGSYEQAFRLVDDHARGLTEAERAGLFGGNCQKFYFAGKR